MFLVILGYYEVLNTKEVFVTQSYLHTFEYTDGYENCAQ